MIKIGIIFAMKEELQELQKQLEIKQEYKIFDCTFYHCMMDHKELILVESGIGKVNAARCCQILIDKMEVDYIFNIGVAGSIRPNISICDIVISESLVQHDFDLTAFNHEKGYIPNVGTYIPADLYLLKIAEKTRCNSKVHKGTIASGDIFCHEKSMGEKIAKKFNASCVEMEGASIAQVCYLSHVPFLVIRSISDSPNADNNELTYEEFLQKSSYVVATYLKAIIKQL